MVIPLILNTMFSIRFDYSNRKYLYYRHFNELAHGGVATTPGGFRDRAISSPIPYPSATPSSSTSSVGGVGVVHRPKSPASMFHTFFFYTNLTILAEPQYF